jgi:hypothetical protein
MHSWEVSSAGNPILLHTLVRESALQYEIGCVGVYHPV